MKPHIGVSVPVFNPHYQIADGGNPGTIAGELLVGRLGIVFLRFYELVVEVQVVFPVFLQLTCCQQTVKKQRIEPVPGIEIVGFPVF